MSNELSLVESLILGVIQGVTEFLPISSDGHLVLGRHLLNYHKDVLVFDVLLHFGTLGSMVLIFRKELGQLLKHSFRLFGVFFKNPKQAIYEIQQPSSARFAFAVILTTFVTGVIGLLAEDFVEDTFKSLVATCIGFLITAGFLFASHFKRQGTSKIIDLSLWAPIWIGAAQSLALLPGVSRSGCTIAAALLLSLHREEAGRYSFVAAIPIIFLAALYQSRHLIGSDMSQAGVTLAGVIASFVVGIVAIRILLWLLARKNLLIFAIYTFLLGTGGLIYSFS